MSVVTPSYTFTPGDIGAGTVAFTLTGFSIKRLKRVVNLTRHVTLYAPAEGITYAAVSGATVTLAVDTRTHNAADVLYVEYDYALPDDYETVAAGQSDQVLGSTGAAGDFLSHLLIVPASTSPGAVSIKDGAGSSITVFAGGASSLSALAPFTVYLGLTAATAWKVTTGSNVSVIAVGDFT